MTIRYMRNQNILDENDETKHVKTEPLHTLAESTVLTLRAGDRKYKPADR